MGARSISPLSEMKLNIEKRSAEVGNASPLVNMEQEPISSTTPRAPLSSRSPEGLSISRNIRTSSTQRNGVVCEGILFCGVPSSGICSISPNRDARSGETRRLEICALARRALTAGYEYHPGDNALPRQGPLGLLQVGLRAGSEIKSADLKKAFREPIAGFGFVPRMSL